MIKAMIESVCDTLTPGNLKKIQDAFDQKQLDGILTSTMVKEFKTTAHYIEGIKETLFDNDAGIVLSKRDQQKIVIALLTSSCATTNLTTHLYIAIAHPEHTISVKEIGDIILLSGIYMGLDCLSGALRVLETSLQTMNEIAEHATDPKVELAPAALIKALADRYAPAPLPAKDQDDADQELIITIAEEVG